MCAGCQGVTDWKRCSLLDFVFMSAGGRDRLAVLFTVGFCVCVCLLGRDRLACCSLLDFVFMCAGCQAVT